MKTGTFDEALEIIESFPEEQKESIIEIVKRRLTEERRERLAQTVQGSAGGVCPWRSQAGHS